MKTLLLLSTLTAGILGSGCAPVAVTRSDTGDRYVCDTERMALVERAAERSYTEIHWLRCPLVKRPVG
jgi:hypothetical protein